MLEQMAWWELFSYAVGIVGIVAGVVFYSKWNQGVKLLLELGEAFAKTGEALADHKLTKSEAIELLKEWYDVYNAVILFLPARLVAKIGFLQNK